MTTLTINNKLHIAAAPSAIERKLRRRLTFTNPAYINAERQGRWTGNIPRTIYALGVDGDDLVLPRGFTRQAIGIIKTAGVPYRLLDRRRTLPEVEFTFTGSLRDFQAEAVQSVLGHDFGVLETPTGSGKTIMALFIVAARKQPSLIIVHTKELLNQWVERIETFLEIDRDEIGIIGGVPAEILHGRMVAKARKEIVAALREGTARVLCATGQLIGKGSIARLYRPCSSPHRSSLTGGYANTWGECYGRHRVNSRRRSLITRIGTSACLSMPSGPGGGCMKNGLNRLPSKTSAGLRASHGLHPSDM